MINMKNTTNMDLDQFVIDFADCFDDTDTELFTPTLVFKELEEWSSLQGLGIIAMCKKKYGIRISGAEIQDADTVQDVYEIVLNRLG